MIFVTSASDIPNFKSRHPPGIVAAAIAFGGVDARAGGGASAGAGAMLGDGATGAVAVRQDVAEIAAMAESANAIAIATDTFREKLMPRGFEGAASLASASPPPPTSAPGGNSSFAEDMSLNVTIAGAKRCHERGMFPLEMRHRRRSRNRDGRLT